MVLLAAAIISFVVPWVVALVDSPILTYTNAWDEETYLSYPGALATRNAPGYFPLHAVVLLHEFGVSGAVQNFVSDVVVVPLILFLLYSTFRSVGRPRGLSVGYSVLIAFGSVLFNYANPHIVDHFGLPRHMGWLLPGWESYATILRTPNPQWSYLFVAAAVYAYVRTRRMWLLLLPLPFLYWFVFVGYSYALSVVAINRYLNMKSAVARFAAAHVATYVVLSSVFGLLYGAMAVRDPFLQPLILEGRTLHIPFAAACSGVLYIGAELLVLSSGCRMEAGYRQWIWTFLLSSLAVVNLQLIAGFSANLKAYADCSASVLCCAAIVLTMDAVLYGLSPAWSPILHYSARLVEQATLIAIVLVLWRVAGFDLYAKQFEVRIGSQPEDPSVIARLREDPLHAVVVDQAFGGKYAYSQAAVLFPPFSYQYTFPRLAFEYPEMEGLRRLALDAARLTWGPKDKRVVNLTKSANRLTQILDESTRWKERRAGRVGIPDDQLRGDFYGVEVGKPLLVRVPAFAAEPLPTSKISYLGKSSPQSSPSRTPLGGSEGRKPGDPIVLDGPVDVVTGDLRLSGQTLQSFTVTFRNTPGDEPVQHLIGADTATQRLGPYVNRIRGASTKFQDTPLDLSSSGFSGGVGQIRSGALNRLVFDIGVAQDPVRFIGNASIVANTSGVSLTAELVTGVVSVKRRKPMRLPQVILRNSATGASFDIGTLPEAKGIALKVVMWVK